MCAPTHEPCRMSLRLPMLHSHKGACKFVPVHIAFATSWASSCRWAIGALMAEAWTYRLAQAPQALA